MTHRHTKALLWAIAYFAAAAACLLAAVFAALTVSFG